MAVLVVCIEAIAPLGPLFAGDLGELVEGVADDLVIGHRGGE